VLARLVNGTPLCYRSNIVARLCGKNTHFRCCIVLDETCSVEWGHPCLSFTWIYTFFSQRYAPKTVFTFLPTMTLTSSLIFDMGKLSSKFERCMILRFRVNGEHGSRTNRQTDVLHGKGRVKHQLLNSRSSKTAFKLNSSCLSCVRVYWLCKIDVSYLEHQFSYRLSVHHSITRQAK